MARRGYLKENTMPRIRRILLAIMVMSCCASLLAAEATSKPTTTSAPATTRPSQPAATMPDITKLIADLSSADGQARVAATKAIFALGKDALEPLKKAGAKQITPKPTGGTGGRIDAVYSLLDGLHQDPVEGYRTDAFLLQVAKECTVEDVLKMGERDGFTIKVRNGINDGYCAAFPKANKDFAEILKALLANEPQVVSVGLMYFVAHPVP
jgi:hypothetical protein